MNKKLHRIVFNAARGMRMVVQETASSTGKGTSKSTDPGTTTIAAAAAALLAPMLAGAAVALLLTAMPAHAQIVGAPNVPGNLRPTVLVAPNGVPIANIQTPSAAGVSRNVFNQFDVNSNGVILNNSRTNVQTQLGGWVQGNPFLATGPARIILNEINSGNPSQLRGYIEVGGQRAEVIIANPAGINVDGGGFINASRATLTTGTPQLNAMGGLDNFLVRGGTITIDGAGLDASKTDYAAILARAVNVNAGIWASELKVVTGANQVSADHSQVTATAGTGAAPVFALDVSQLGGMYANKIVLVGTQQGLGVRNAGTIQANGSNAPSGLAGPGQLIVTAAGRLENAGTIQATSDAGISAASIGNAGSIASAGRLNITTSGDLSNALNGVGGTLEGQSIQLASTAGNLDNRGGTIRQTSYAPLTIAAPTLSNTNGGWIGAEPAPAPTAGTDGSGSTGTPTGATGSGAGTSGGSATADGGSSTGGATSAPAAAPIAPGSITAGGAVLNDGGRIYAGGPITLQSPNLINTGGTLSVANMALNQASFSNHGGTLNVSGAFSANVDSFDNSTGTVHAGNLNIATNGDLLNVDGTLISDADASLTVGGLVNNTRGTIAATGAMTANVAGAVNNNAGTLSANNGLRLTAASLDNTKGSVQSANATTQVAVTGQLLNAQGTIAAGTDLGISAGSLTNTGSLRGSNDASVSVAGAATNDGSITAGRNLTVTADSLQAGTASALGAGVQNDGSLGATGNLSVTTVHALAANGTNIAAGDIALQGASVDLSGSKTSATNIALTATQGNVVTSNASVVTPGTLSVTANSQSGQTLVNDAGSLNAGQLDLHASNITNTSSGEIVQTGTTATTIDVAGTLNNNGGRIAANSQDLTLSAAAITNANGKIEHAGSGALNITGGSYSGPNGQITGNGNLVVNLVRGFQQDGGTTTAKHITVDAGSLSNRGGEIVQAGTDATRITVVGALDNSNGHIASNGQDLRLQAATATNTAGTIEHAGAGTLNIAGGSFSGTGGTITANGALVVNLSGVFGQDAGTTSAKRITIDAGALSNRGGEIVQSGTDATRISVAGTLDNTSGHIASNGQDLSLQSGAMVSTDGKIEHAGAGTLRIAGGSFSGANGTITGNGALAVNLSGAFDQSGGKTYANQVDIAAASLGNQGGSIVQGGTGTTTLTIGGAVTNNAGTIASNGDIVASAGSLSNQGGTLQAAGTSDLTLHVANQLDNSAAGSLLVGGNATLQAGSLNNDSGKLTAVGNLSATVSNAASNQAGTLAANGSTTLSAASFNNNGGTTAAVSGALTATVSGTASNIGGTLQAGGATMLGTGVLDNTSGKVFGDSIGVDTHGQSLSNAHGTIAATTTVDVQSGALANDAGLIQSGGAMTVNTHGQALSNTNAAGYANGQGGLASSGTLDLTTAGVDNTAGFIGARNALTASTQGFSNVNGGLVVGQSTAAINANGATYDNTGGQTQAAGDLTLSAGGINNTGGLIRSMATSTLNANLVVNGTTQGANQGIEGNNVAINAHDLNNTSGAIRADGNTTITAGGSVNNTAGLISAGGTLAILDPSRGNPAAKTLGVTNTNGTLVADSSVQIDAANFSGDGQLVSGKDLSLALTQDLVNNAQVVANGNLSYGTTGNLTNNGKLSAGQTLTVSGNVVENTANAEMSGVNTTVNAGTLNNRGLIDSGGTTRINAGAVNNVGSGRIYGNAIAIAAGSLTNDVETVNGVTQAGTIAARQSLDIGAGTVTNREHALIFSGGDMAIGGSLDAAGKASGQGAKLDNLSADIESLGNMTIAMGQINNLDTHVRLGPQQTTNTTVTSIAPIGGSGMYLADQVIVIPGQPFVWARNPDGSQGALLGSNGYGIWNTTFTTTKDTAVNTDPARITSGGDMTLVGAVHNHDSRITAGGTFTAANVDNQGIKGNYRTTSLSIVVNEKGQLQPPVAGPTDAGSVEVGAFTYVDHVNATTGYGAGSATPGSTSANAGGTGGVGNGARPGTIVEVAANTPDVVDNLGPKAPAAGTPRAGTATGASASADASADSATASASQTIPMVVRTATPSTALPQASLFKLHSDATSHYLVETDPRFANYRTWLSSDYLLNALGLDPNNILKRLGDGFYEQKLIREQVAQLTGYRYLDGFTNDDDQYTALMDAGVTFAKQYGLRPGIALTAAQMAQLTSDIVWLVEQTVTLPDGTTQKVLVPQLYVRVRPGDIDGSGAVLSADATVIKGTGDLVNTGTIAGRSLVSINADNVNNLAGGRIAGGSVGINAKNDINNIGASITAADAAVLTAGRDINIQTTTASGSAGNNRIDRVAGVYVSNPDGVLIASAGRDVNLIAGIMNSGGSVSVGAGRNINLGTVTETSAVSTFGNGIAGIASSSREIGSVIQADGNVRIAAGNDLNIRASAVQSANGALVATAKNDINLTEGQATSSVATATVSSSRSALKKTSSSTFDSTSTTDVLSSSLSGKTVALVAGNDINARAAQLNSQDEMSLSAGRDINFTIATQTTVEQHASQSRTSSTELGNLAAVSVMHSGIPGQEFAGAALMGGQSANGASASTTNQAVGTSVSAGKLQMVSGRDATLQAATVVADHDVTMMAGRNLTIESAQNTSLEVSSQASSKSGLVGTTWYNPSIGNVKGFGANATNTTTQQASQVASLQGNVTLVAGNEYRQTASSVLAAGQAGPLVGGDVNILARNVTINEAYNTQQSVDVQRSSSTSLGGSASVGFMSASVSTDNIKGSVSTIQAIGQTSNGRAQALGVLNLAMTGKQAYDTATGLSSRGAAAGVGDAAGGATGAAGASGSSGLTYGVSASLSRNESQGTSFTTSTQAIGSSVMGANNVNIVATGGGSASNIHAVGSTIAAGNTVNLAADNDILLEASRNTSVTAGRNSSSGESVGVTYGAGAQNGVSIQLGVSSGKGRDNQNEISYNATQVTGGKAVNIVSGGNLTLNGATIEANRVTADVGGNLNITTLQDVSVGQSHQSSGGLNVSLCIPPICYGAPATVSGSVAGAKADGTYVSPAVQSGIKAGDGGFDVNVKGNTNLVGAVIESTQAAIDNNKNNFATGGTLTMTDLQNVSQSSGSGYAVSGGVSVGYTTAPVAANAETGAAATGSTFVWSDGNSRPSGSAGLGSYSGDNQSSTTRSGISGVAGDQSVRTGDSSSAGTLVRNWNTQTIVQDVQAQAQITQQFGQQAARAIGDYADQQEQSALRLRAQASLAQDPETSERLTNQAASIEAQWGEGGVSRVALHVLAGALGGGVNGALGAGASASAAPLINSLQDAVASQLVASGVSADSAQAAARIIAGATATGLGAVIGTAGGAASALNTDLNNRQLAPQEQNLLRQRAQELAAASGNSKNETYWYNILSLAGTATVDAQSASDLRNYLDNLAQLAERGGNAAGAQTFVRDLQTAFQAVQQLAGKTIYDSQGNAIVADSGVLTTFYATGSQYTNANLFAGASLGAMASILALNGGAIGTVDASYLQAGAVNAQSNAQLGQMLNSVSASTSDAAQSICPECNLIGLNVGGIARGLAGSLAGASSAAAQEVAVTASLAQTVADLRAALPSSARTGGNIGVADIQVFGLPETMAASSRIGNPTAAQQALGFVGEVPETFVSSEVPISGVPVNRSIDSEAKIINNIALQLGDKTSTSGVINLFTERAPCASCANVIEGFRQKYPNILINVYDNGGKIVLPTRKN